MAIHTLKIEYEEFEFSDELPPGEANLITLAWKARDKAYAPYSHFKVGAAILTKDQKIFPGSNQEVANYKGSCAERVAINAASAAGYHRHIAKLAVVGGPETLDVDVRPNEDEEPVTPCGQCRQDLKEVEDLAGDPIVIILASRNRIRRVVGISTLLPFAFGPANLGISMK